MKPSLFIRFVIILCLLSFDALGQDQSGELIRALKPANTPEAEAFTKYGNTSVSMYTGSPNIQVPIYTHKGRELDLPISLTYDASGIKVEQLATFVGLGWNLNFGGRISRIQNGLVDDYYHSSNLYSSINQDETRLKILEYTAENIEFEGGPQAVEDYYTFLKNADNNLIDTERDYYSFNVMGLNDTFVFDIETMTPVALNNPNLLIETTFSDDESRPYIIGWIVTDINGTKYYFEQAEKKIVWSETNSDNAIAQALDVRYNSSWLLTKIESPNKKDIYQFTYFETDFSQDVTMIGELSNVTNNIPFGAIMPPIVDTPTGYTKNSQEVFYTRLYINTIVHNEEIIMSTNLTDRFDNDDKAKKLSTITIKNQPGSNIFSKFNFNYSYFKIDPSIDPAFAGSKDIRLKLDNITLESNNGVLRDHYSFAYYSPYSLPRINSYSQDYMGYYNGKLNDELYPEYVLNEFLTPENQTIFKGADRSVSEVNTINGTLKRITYPTGGYSEFEFENHDVPEIVSSTTKVTVFNAGVGSNDSSDLYFDENGTPCDDKFLDQNPPGVKSGKFRLDQPIPYYFDYSGSGNSFEIFIYALYDEDNPNCTYNSDGTLSCPVGLPNVTDPTSRCDFPSQYTPIANINVSGEQMLPGMGLADVFNANAPQSHIKPGWYFYLIAADETDDGGGTSCSFEIYSYITSESANSVKKAGLRVKSIKDYSNESVKVSEKVYRYKQAIDSDISSGKVLFEPKFSYLQTYEKYIQDLGETITTSVLHRNSLAFGNSSQPHVAYNRVYEFHNSTETPRPHTNGYIEHNFSVGVNGIVTSRKIPPYTNSYIANHLVEKEIETKVFEKSNTEVKKNETVYSSENIFYQTGISLNVNSNNIYKYIVPLYGLNSDTTTYTLVDGCWACYTPPDPNEICEATLHCPKLCYPENRPCIFDPSYSVLELNRYTISGAVGNTVSVNSIEYFSDDLSEYVSTSQSYVYDPETYLLKEENATNSKGEVLSTKFFYPPDFNTLVYNAMTSSNRIADIVVQENYLDGVKMSTTKRNYYQTLDGFFPEYSEEIKADNLSGTGTKTEYFYNDESSNLVGFQKENGSKTFLLWGYNNRYPIARIDNIYCFPTSSGSGNFDSSCNTSNHLISLLSEIQNVSNNEFDSNAENNLRDLFHQLRQDHFFNDAFITTYTYDPSIGITSVTDPRGYTMYYHYDDFNRLEYVKDADGNILSENDYNYRPQPQN